MRTLFFDLDDTIVKFDAVSGKAWDEVCEKHIQNFSSLSVTELKEAILKASNWFWSDEERFRKGRLSLKQARRDVLARTFEDLETQNIQLPEKEVAHAIVEHFTVLREEIVEPFPGAIETLETLKQRGTPMALLTNGSIDTQQSKIERFNLAQYFDIILIEGVLGYGKPDPRVFNKALNHFNIDPSKATMIGDSLKHDIVGAQNLGITTIWNDWKQKGLPEEAPTTPDRIICNISELI